MMSFFDKFMKKIGLDSDADDYDEYDDEYEEDEDFESEDDYLTKEPEFGRKKSFKGRSGKSIDEDSFDDEFGYGSEGAPVKKNSQTSGAGSNVVNMRTRRSANNLEVCMIKPSSMDDARQMCDILLSGRPVVINMEGLHVDLAQRLIDFSSGACYAINGKLQKISNFIFIVTPSSVDLSGDFQSIMGGAADKAPTQTSSYHL